MLRLKFKITSYQIIAMMHSWAHGQNFRHLNVKGLTGAASCFRDASIVMLISEVPHIKGLLLIFTKFHKLSANAILSTSVVYVPSIKFQLIIIFSAENTYRLAAD